MGCNESCGELFLYSLTTEELYTRARAAVDVSTNLTSTITLRTAGARHQEGGSCLSRCGWWKVGFELRL